MCGVESAGFLLAAVDVYLPVKLDVAGVAVAAAAVATDDDDDNDDTDAEVDGACFSVTPYP